MEWTWTEGTGGPSDLPEGPLWVVCDPAPVPYLMTTTTGVAVATTLLPEKPRSVIR